MCSADEASCYDTNTLTSGCDVGTPGGNSTVDVREAVAGSSYDTCSGDDGNAASVAASCTPEGGMGDVVCIGTGGYSEAYCESVGDSYVVVVEYTPISVASMAEYLANV